MSDLKTTNVLVVGLGGLGCPVSRVLVQAGVGGITLVDDDRVDASNLHRQTLYSEQDCGELKVEAGARALRRVGEAAGHRPRVRAVAARVLPERALDLITGHDLIVEGGDNFATKFMMADAAGIAGVPIVQAGSVRWSGWALGVQPGSGPCLRCIFEDIPRGTPETCAAAGVIGPVVGVLGALQAAIALSLLMGKVDAAGELYHYRGLEGRLRKTRPAATDSCPLCSGQIREMDMARYMPPDCAA